MKPKDSQNNLVLKHLLKHNRITPLQALNRYGVFRLAAVIARIKKCHVDIRTDMVTSGGKRFARYVLVNPNA